MIDVKTEAQFAEMDIAAESRRAVSELFGDSDAEELSRISELPGIDPAVAKALLDNEIDYIEDFLNLTREQLEKMPDISFEQIEILRKLIEDSVEIVEETEENPDETESAEEESLDEEEEIADEVECPECQARFSLDMAGVSGGTINCPNCGAELELSYERDEEEQEE
jgi:N utilization substance protein A